MESLIEEISKAGYHFNLEGPDMTKVTPAYRWTLRLFSNETNLSGPVRRKMFHCGHPEGVLGKALEWIVDQQAEAQP